MKGRIHLLIEKTNVNFLAFLDKIGYIANSLFIFSLVIRAELCYNIKVFKYYDEEETVIAGERANG